MSSTENNFEQDIKLEDLPEDKYLQFWFLKFRKALIAIKNKHNHWPPEKYIARDALREFDAWVAVKEKDKPKEEKPNGGTTAAV